MVGPLALLKEMKIKRVMNAVVAGTSAQSTSAQDMAGFDSVCFVALLGTVTDNSVLTLTINENTTNSNSGGSAVTNGATAAATAATSSSLLLVVDVHNITKQYVYATLTRTAQNAVIDGMIAIFYNARSVPQGLDATILAAALAIP